MSFSCLCDDYPSFHRSSIVRGRKEYRCHECGEVIPRGVPHEYYVQKFDGDVRYYRTCERCADLRQSYIDMGYCVTLGDLWQDHLDMLAHSPETKAYQIAKAVLEEKAKAKSRLP